VAEFKGEILEAGGRELIQIQRVIAGGLIKMNRHLFKWVM
jgi:hypothetical protein